MDEKFLIKLKLYNFSIAVYLTEEKNVEVKNGGRKTMLPAKTAKYNKQNILDGNPRILLGQEVIYSSGPAHLLAST